MIKIPQPSIVLNSHDVPPPPFKMWKTYEVPKHASVQMITLLTKSFTMFEDNKMKCLVMNCHGFTNGKDEGGFGFSMGQGITKENVHNFSRIKGVYKCIIIVACQAANTAKFTYKGESFEGNGARLCAELARCTGAYVIAPIKDQTVNGNRAIPANHIDNFEGLVLRYKPSGVLDRKGFLGRRLIKQVCSNK